MATPVFCCGFECGQFGTVGQHLNATVGSSFVSFVTSPVHSGSRVISFNTAVAESCMKTATGGALGTTNKVGRIYVRFLNLPDQNVLLFGDRDSNIGLSFIVATSTLRLTVAGVSGASFVSITTGVWYRLDLRITYGSIMSAQVDGVSLTDTTISGITATDGEIYFGLVQLASAPTAAVYFDDLLCSATSADYPLGPGQVLHFVPTSDGAHNIAGTADFIRGAAGVDILNATTDSYLLVDEVPIDGTTPTTNDYINCIAPPAATQYTENKFGPAPGVTPSQVPPRAVECIVAYHEAGTGLGVSAIKLNDNGTENSIWDVGSAAGATTIRYTTKQYATPPTGGTWKLDNSGAGAFNNLRIRFGYSSDANPDQYFDCAMIEAEFPMYYNADRPYGPIGARQMQQLLAT